LRARFHFTVMILSQIYMYLVKVSKPMNLILDLFARRSACHACQNTIHFAFERSFSACEILLVTNVNLCLSAILFSLLSLAPSNCFELVSTYFTKGNIAMPPVISILLREGNFRALSYHVPFVSCSKGAAPRFAYSAFYHGGTAYESCQ
jgi:hypothetical protein